MILFTFQISSAVDDVFDEDIEDMTSSSASSTTIKKGLLWQQRDKLFSRWKERYFILTKDFLQCFKKETSKITDMGGFIFKVGDWMRGGVEHWGVEGGGGMGERIFSALFLNSCNLSIMTA